MYLYPVYINIGPIENTRKTLNTAHTVSKAKL